MGQNAPADIPIRIGTCAWSYDDWRGAFYPEHLPATERLQFYARHFPTVEVDSTFYATIELHRNGDRYEVSSRPSDAIALAVRLSVPIFANEEVLEEASILIPGEEEEEVEKFREFLDNVTPEDFNPEGTG